MSTARVESGSRGVVMLLALLAVIAASYAIALPGPFQFDDYATVAVDPGAQWLELWWRDIALHVRPLAKLSFVGTHALGEIAGDIPAVHRAGNLALHLAVVASLVALGRALTNTVVPTLDARHASLAVLAAAAVTGIHPLATEAVAYIGARSMVLGTLAVVASTIAWIRWRTSGRRSGLVVALACWLAGVASREAAIVAPLAWLLWEASRTRAETPPFSIARLRSLAPTISVTSALVALGTVALIMHPRYSGLLDVSATIASERWSEPSLLGALRYFVESLLMLRYPTVDPDPVTMSVAGRVVAAVLACGAIVFAWRVRRTRPHWLFGSLWIGLWLAPIYAFPIRHDALAERHFYPAIWGAAFPLAVAIASGHRARRLAPIAACLVALAFATVTLTRLADYRSETALWEAALRSTPAKARVINNLGFAYMEAGRWDDAVRVLSMGRALYPDDERIRENLRKAEERGAGPRAGYWGGLKKNRSGKQNAANEKAFVSPSAADMPA